MKTEKIKCHPVTFGGSIEEGKPYSNFKKKILRGLKFRVHGKVNLRIELFIRRDRIRKNRNDLDNFLKPIIDAINYKDSIDDESMIESIFIKRKEVDKEEGIVIEINPV